VANTPHGKFRIKRSRPRDAVSSDGNIRFLSPEDLKFFVIVGIRGLLPDGREDATFERKTAFRNYVMTRLLVATGLRIEEASALLTWELPRIAPERLAAQKTVKLRVPRAIAKRGREREVVVSAGDYLLIQEYIDVERRNILDRIEAHGSEYPPVRNPIRVKRSNKQYRLLDREGSPSRAIDTAPPQSRIRFVESSDGGPAPVWTWLDHETGAPLGTRAWNDVFLAASARCRKFGRDLHVTPHMLRHSFAVSYLSHLIETNLGLAKLDDLSGNCSPPPRHVAA
jgi:integrase